MTTDLPPAPGGAPAPGAVPVVPAGSPPAVGGHGRPRDRFVRRVWRGRPEDARWVRPAFLGLLAALALAYLWNLSASGYANSFYSAAAQAGSESWKAFFFGSSDAANAITVDKPPAALWPMGLSVRILGLNSWAILLPEVLMGVATAGVLYGAVRRRFSAAAGLITVLVLATVPVAALMFRFNNPDALLALLMTVTVACVLRAMEHGRTKWLLWAGAAVGLAFLTKTLQAFLVLPPLTVLYAVLAPGRFRRRLGQLALSGLVMTVAGGWWVAIVTLWPASSRPYIGGSQHNSFLELTFGYNGLGRINGEETGSVGGGGGGMGGSTGQWGETGLGRMFDSETGGQISWLIPAALILFVAGVVLTWTARRTDTARAAFLAWGGSLVTTGLVFSFMAGIFHQYYTVALAPYIAALIGMGVTVLWEERARIAASATLGVAVGVTGVWGYVLLGRTPDHLPWLRWFVLVGGLVAGLGLAFVGRLDRRLAIGAVGLGVVASLAGPTAYTVSTLNTGHTGSIVTAGPSGASMRGGMGGGPGGPGGGGGGGKGGFPGGGMPGRQQNQNQNQPNQPNQNQPNQNQPNQNQSPNQQPNQKQGAMPGRMGAGEGGGGAGRGGMGGMGGLLNGATVSGKAKKLLQENAEDYTWAAAAVGSQNQASYQLATGAPVMAISGFNGTDPSPTPAQFKRYVADGKIHYFIGGGSGGGTGGSGSGSASKITSWVEDNFKKVTVGDATFYDLTRPKS
ncbi:phospholipid carrier-dependent glycosyltransferase [Streptomyces sp. SID14478]|uniref:glycosyltransferase family 39 protein n=1 Tax=Streptomyces sp. SID14478 TaxID=2706073 RepID=UPI0013DAD3D8|nr:glycosyltransferase family 39 protein [Streptomyces sp. SID14478]NEB73830.1 phospholipid carrier-dependent glycosyltransferase [Streptomyces sp. SID14478]